ncbi:MAG: lytic transglycosylase domain-containing protein [Syntrophorhabdus sp.]
MITRFRLQMCGFSLIVALCFTIPAITFYCAADRQQHIKDQIAVHIRNGNDDLEPKHLGMISRTLYETSRQYGIDYRLILALMKIESNFQHDVVSPKGARGLLQIKPSFAKFVARDIGIEWNGNQTIDDPDNNIKIGIRVLSEFVHRFNDVATALRAYNMGPGKTRELTPDKMRSSKGFPGLVLREYDKNIIILPDP